MKHCRRIITLLLILVLLLLNIPAHAEQGFSDISGHWAEAAILRWNGLGILSGYPDGAFRPNNTVTRGELAAIINKLMQFPAVPADVALFADMPRGAWYAGHINALALQGAYLVSRGEANGGAVLTREEAAAMIFNSFALENPSGELFFTDSAEISPDYLQKIGIMQNTGFLSGFPDGSFRPKAPITRAQVLAILDNMITDYITKPGTYETLEGGRVLAAVPNVTLKASCEYLVISPSAGMGTTYVYGNVEYATLWDGTSVPVVWRGERPSYEARRYVHPYDDRFAGGLGKEWSPYLIQDQAQLELLNNYYNTHNADMHFALANNITLSGLWVPIGAFTNSRVPQLSFFGTLDGKGHSILGLYITEEISESEDDYFGFRPAENVGLFGYMCGTLRNLTVSGDILLDTSSPRLFVGGICGHMYNASVENCVSYVNISVKMPTNIFAGGIAGSSLF